MNYSSLEQCLVNQDWQAADGETHRLMTAIRDRTHQQIQTQIQAEAPPCPAGDAAEQWRWQRQRQHHLAIANVPLTDWQQVDRLWVTHSGGRFGFTVQLRLWLELGALLGEDYGTYGDHWGWHLNRQFAERVGWQPQIVDASQRQPLIWSVQAPVGHLPGYTYRQSMGAFKWGGEVLNLSNFFNPLLELAVAAGIMDRRCLRVLKGSAAAVRSLAITASDRTLATGSDDGSIRLWDIATGELHQTIAAHRQPITALAMAGGDRYLVSGSHDHTIQVWDWQTQTLQQTMTCDSPISAIALTPSASSWVSSGCVSSGCVSSHHDGSIRLWRLADGALLATHQENLGVPDDLIAQLQILPNGAVVSKTIQPRAQAQISLTSLKTGRSKPIASGHLNAIALSNNGQFLLRSSRPNAAATVDAGVAGMADPLYQQVFNPLVLVDVATEQPICRLERSALNAGLDGVAFYGDRINPDAASLHPTVVTPSHDTVYMGVGRWIRVWDGKTGKLQQILGGHSRRITAIALTTDAQTLISASEDGEMRIWQVSSSVAELGYRA